MDQFNNRMMKNVFLSGLLVVVFQFAQAQETINSQLFEQYKLDKSKSLLPDFSYAGYQSGEKAIPEIKNYKLFNVVDFGAKPNDEISVIYKV